jgi:NADH-quinone oxidoreductase subunit E
VFWNTLDRLFHRGYPDNPMQELTKEKVIKIMESYGNDPQQIIAVLLDIQAASGRNYVEQRWAELASQVMSVPLSKVFDLLTFYAMFSTVARGEYVIEICQSTPCEFTKAEEVVRWFEAAAGIKVGETTADNRITLFRTSCVGACEIGPVAKIGDDVFGNLTEEKVKALVKHCREGKTEGLQSLCQN